MFNSGTTDFEQMARQYWSAWGNAMRGTGQATGGFDPGTRAWGEAIDWWTRQASGDHAGVNDVLGRFNTQARDWYGRMQQVAAQFAGRGGSPAEIVQAWKQALGGAGANPFPDMFRSMRGPGLAHVDQWLADASPWLGMFRDEGMAWLRMPAFGFTREHQERLQALARHQAEYQEQLNAYNALMLKASQSAFDQFERKLAEREEQQRPIETPRALFDLWIDAAEDAYAEVALSLEFREAYGRLVDAQMRLRAGVQREVEKACELFGIPTRTEVDSAHRKITELERTLRRMRDAEPEARRDTPKPPPRKPTPAPAPKAAAKPEPKSKPKPKSAKAAAPAKKAAAKRAETVSKSAPRPTVKAKAPSGGFATGIPSMIPAAPQPLASKPGKTGNKRTR